MARKRGFREENTLFGQEISFCTHISASTEGEQAAATGTIFLREMSLVRTLPGSILSGLSAEMFQSKHFKVALLRLSNRIVEEEAK